MGQLSKLKKELTRDLERGLGKKNFNRLKQLKKASKTVKGEYRRRKKRGSEKLTKIINDRYGKKEVK